MTEYKVKAHRSHQHSVDASRVAPPAVISCGWKHQLLDNVQLSSAQRLFQQLLDRPVTPVNTRLGLWLMGRGDSNSDR